MEYKTPCEVIKDVTLDMTNGLTDNPEALSSTLRKEITRRSMIEFGRMLCNCDEFKTKSFYEASSLMAVKYRDWESNPLPVGQIGY